MTPFFHDHLMFVIISLVCLLFMTLILGFLISGTAGYMAALVGSFNSPLSPLGILALIILAVLMALLGQIFLPHIGHVEKKALMSLVIISTSCIFSMACVANDNMQDLKTGQLVGSTPWKQQCVLIIGIMVGSLIIPYILNQMYLAYGFLGHLPSQSMNSHLALAIPQAHLMAALLSGVIEYQFNWYMMLIGVLIGFVLIVAKRFCARSSFKISIMSVAIGMYLPFTITSTIIIGGLMQGIARVKGKRESSEKSTLFASGLIVGNAFVAVILAALIVYTGEQNPIAYVGIIPRSLVWPGLLLFVIILGLFLRFLYKLEHDLIKS